MRLPYEHSVFEVIVQKYLGLSGVEDRQPSEVLVLIRVESYKAIALSQVSGRP